MSGRGVIPTGKTVCFARARQESFARRTLKPRGLYTVAACDWHESAEAIYLRLAEHPGLSFRRTMFDVENGQ